ncbi:L-threonine 3-dehydrogenase [Coxiella-like endosymbiont of Rhipicephalus sanguineus]|uniref:L-threonine 3-dehydrogenase n=1 Tax=Coxiella-like endosymbiont of Rhipicephalus sanguineus TaxID=1955402 RepID=UPI002040EF88|nr:L-threonine 3-dehydrogenase [Coxiella-like endosymbiont of Rhipicephalus sanguineus]MBT8506656.1 L-threonine 3-dehydrogenase [Coxiella-like endosymbiont of Rhipicephalus sanguineus]
MKTLSKLKSKPGIWVSEVPTPKPERDEVLIKIKKTAICGTDLHIYKWDEWAQKTIPVPMHVGHEFVGEIVEMGQDIKGFNIGDRVSGEGHITCGYCRNCRAGKRHLCRNTLGVGVNRPGAFADYLVIPSRNAYKILPQISDNTAAILDPFGNAAHSALEFDLVGEDVLITGAGPVGLMAAAIARHVGARYVVITDVNEYRLALAEKIGVTLAVNPTSTSLTKVMENLGMTEGFDIGLEMSGNAEAFRSMLTIMNNGGRIAFLGIPPTPFAIDWNLVVFKSLTIKGIYGRRMFETWYKMINLLQSGLDISPVITHEFPLKDFQQAFDVMLSGKAGKVILDWV